MYPSPSLTQVILFVLLLAWLGACVACDLRSRQVPALLTIPALTLSIFWRLFQGGWLMVLLVIIVIVVSDLPWKKWRIPFAGLASLLALSITRSTQSVYAIVALFAAWVLWEVGATGGADAKVIISLVLFFGNGLFFIPIVLAGGVQGLIGLIARKETIPYTVAITLGTAAWLWLSVGR